MINMTSSLIYPLGDTMLFSLVFTAAFISAITAWVLSRAAPKEEIDLFSLEGPWAQRMSIKLSIYTWSCRRHHLPAVGLAWSGYWLGDDFCRSPGAAAGDHQHHGRR